jgi:hypothetical protein
MSASVGLTVRAVMALVSILAAAIPAAAQLPQRPLPEPPASAEFMPRFDMHLAAALLADNGDDDRFSWDTHWGGGIDLVDYVAGRMSFYADYQAVLGNEFRPFDPNQGNYVLDASGSIRAGRTELAVVLHHLSRHLSDRPKRQSIAMNALLVRALRQFDVGGATIDLRADTGPVIARAEIDYTWQTVVDLLLRTTLRPNVGFYGRAWGEIFAVDESLRGRNGQQGGRLESGVRFSGRGGAIELFGGFEKVIDAHQLEFEPKRWVFFGFRVVNN